MILILYSVAIVLLFIAVPLLACQLFGRLGDDE